MSNYELEGPKKAFPIVKMIPWMMDVIKPLDAMAAILVQDTEVIIACYTLEPITVTAVQHHYNGWQSFPPATCRVRYYALECILGPICIRRHRYTCGIPHTSQVFSHLTYTVNEREFDYSKPPLALAPCIQQVQETWRGSLSDMQAETIDVCKVSASAMLMRKVSAPSSIILTRSINNLRRKGEEPLQACHVVKNFKLYRQNLNEAE